MAVERAGTEGTLQAKVPSTHLVIKEEGSVEQSLPFSALAALVS